MDAGELAVVLKHVLEDVGLDGQPIDRGEELEGVSVSTFDEKGFLGRTAGIEMKLPDGSAFWLDITQTKSARR